MQLRIVALGELRLLAGVERREERPQRRAADPGEYLFEQDAEHERTLFVIEVSDADDDAGRASVLGFEPFGDVHR